MLLGQAKREIIIIVMLSYKRNKQKNLNPMYDCEIFEQQKPLKKNFFSILFRPFLLSHYFGPTRWTSVQTSQHFELC